MGILEQTFETSTASRSGLKQLLGRAFPPQDYSADVSYRPPASWYRRLNRVVGVPLTSLGLAPRDAVTLEVRGRRTGALRRTPVLVTENDGAEYLVALAGESDWVRNVRADGGSAALRRRGVRRCRLVEVPVSERVPVLAAYLTAGRRRSGAEGARVQARYNFGLTDGDTASLAARAARYPVFRVDDSVAGTSRSRFGARARTGVFANGMRYVTWGCGPRTMLFLPGGPGNMVPEGILLRSYEKRFRSYLEAGFQPWIVGRRPGMTTDYTMADMADDYATLIEERFAGRVDVVLGESYGGCVAQYLAARHPAMVDKLVLVVTGSRVTEAGLRLDRRLTDALIAKDARLLGDLVADLVLGGGDRLDWLRPLLRHVLGRAMAGTADYRDDDLRAELAAEEALDSRAILPAIQAPTLMVAGDQDIFFSTTDVTETAAMIPDCTLRWYCGMGHLRTAASSRLPRDVLAFAASRS